jgi:hypothetical protein
MGGVYLASCMNQRSFIKSKELPKTSNKGESHRGLAIYTKKDHKAQKKICLWKLKYFTMQNM